MTEKILVVDDEEDILRIIELELCEAGYEVLTASSGEEGIAKAKSGKPAVILLDVNMPGMDGGATACHLKNDPATENIPIIFLTSLVKKEELAKKGMIGDNFFVSKPCTSDELLNAVKRHLPRRSEP